MNGEAGHRLAFYTGQVRAWPIDSRVRRRGRSVSDRNHGELCGRIVAAWIEAAI
jgi:hypothetical protein